ncbi:unnamed protein product [Ectocarpus sp. CCAP 1310/34]|nr:unnamed protein product [Ectocarpus sp. CCAP 1310/34]
MPRSPTAAAAAVVAVSLPPPLWRRASAAMAWAAQQDQQNPPPQQQQPPQQQPQQQQQQQQLQRQQQEAAAGAAAAAGSAVGGDEARLADGMAGLSVEGLGGSSTMAGGNNLGAGAASVSPGALQLVMLQQYNENLVAKVSALEQSLQQLLNNQGGGAGSHVVGPHAADGAGAAVAVGAGLGAAAAPGSDADRQRRFAKAEFESTASAWRAGRLMWALRGKRGIDVPNKETLQTMMGGTVTGTDKTLQQLRTMSGLNVLDFFPVGNSGELSVPDHFDLTCAAIVNVLKFGLSATSADNAAALARLLPMEQAMLSARGTLRMQALRHMGDFQGRGSRGTFADLPNDDFREWANAVMLWMLPMQNLPVPPESFERFGPPPVPRFDGINGFSMSGSIALRMFGTVGGGGSSGSSGVRDGGGTPAPRVGTPNAGRKCVSNIATPKHAGGATPACSAMRLGAARVAAAVGVALRVEGEPRAPRPMAEAAPRRWSFAGEMAATEDTGSAFRRGQLHSRVGA